MENFELLPMYITKVNNKDVDQTAWMRRLVGTFVVRKPGKRVFSPAYEILVINAFACSEGLWSLHSMRTVSSEFWLLAHPKEEHR